MRNSSLLKDISHKFLVFIAAVGLQISCFAQTPVFSNYSVEDGLPSSESYFSIQDSKGYIWVSTDRGVARYDGYEFELFTTDNGLPDNVVFKMHEDIMNRIWFVPFSLKLSYYLDGKIYTYKHNDTISKYIGEAIIHNFYVDSLGTLHLGTYLKGYFTIDKDGNIVSENKKDDPQLNIKVSIVENELIGSSRELLLANNYERNEYLGTKRTLISIDKNKKRQLNKTSFPAGQPILGTNFAVEIYPKTNQIYLGIRGVLFDYNIEENILKELWNPKAAIYWIHSNKRWLLVGTNKKGMYVFDKEKSINTPAYQFLDGKSISAIMQDKEEGYWITTLENGIYHTTNIQNLAYTKNDGLSENYVSAIGGNKQGDLLIGHRNSKIDLVKNGKYHNTLDLHKKGIAEITIIRYDTINDQNIIAGPGLFAYQNNMVDTLEASTSPKDFASLGKDKWLMCRMNLFLLDRDSIIYLTGEKKVPNCRCLYKINEDSILIGGLNGLYVYANGDYTFLGKNQSSLSFRVTDIKRVNAFNYALATRGAGVVMIGRKDTFNITEKHGLAGNQLNNLFIDQDKNIWAVTNKGVSMLSATDPYAIYTLNRQQGLLSNEVTSVYVDDQYVWIGTKRGMNRIPKKEIQEMAKPLTVKIKSIQVNSKVIEYDNINPIEMTYDKAFLQVHMTTLDYRSRGNPTYRYRFKELGNEWIEIESNTIQIPSVPSGEHTLELMAKNEDGIWSTVPTQLFFNVSYPFWMTWWFYLSSLALVGGLISGYNYIQIQRAKERTRLKEEIRNYQQQAFTAQMNPHFIFNSLNSIQNFIVQNDSKQSNRYLAKFAKLMRMVLANSQRPKVSIEDEMTTLSFYLELEALRFNQSLSYEIEIDKSIDKEKALIPTLLIQPFVENAIWHGIMHREEGGKLKVKLYLIENQLKCSIEDNGIGRKAAESLHTKKSHESFSSSATQKRLALLTEEYKMDYEFSIEDLQDKKGKGTGTVVSFQLPYELHEN